MPLLCVTVNGRFSNRPWMLWFGIPAAWEPTLWTVGEEKHAENCGVLACRRLVTKSLTRLVRERISPLLDARTVRASRERSRVGSIFDIVDREKGCVGGGPGNAMLWT